MSVRVRSQNRGCPCVPQWPIKRLPARARFALRYASRSDVFESHRAPREDCANLQLATERPHELPKCAQMHVGAAFQARHGYLRNLEFVGELLLRHLQGFAKLSHFDFSQVPLREFAGFTLRHRTHRFVFQIAPFCPHSDQPLFLEFRQIAAIDAIRKSDGFLVPAFRTLAPANQQDSCLARIEGEKHTIWLATVLNAQFHHLRKARTFDRIASGLPSTGPSISSKSTLRPMEICSASANPANHCLNSSVASMFHAIHVI